MFQDTRRGWEARLGRDSVDVQRSAAYQTDRKARRRHSTLAEHTEHLLAQQVAAGGPRHLHDRKERKKERHYTSSAFDATKTKINVNPPPKTSPTSSEPNSSPSSSGSSSNSPASAKNSLKIEIPETAFKGYPPQGRAEDELSFHHGNPSNGRKLSYAPNRTDHVRSADREYRPRQLFRVTSNFEQSSGLHMGDSSSIFYNRVSLDKHALNKRTLDNKGLVPIPSPEKRLHSDLVSPRHADRERTSRDEGLRARVSPRSPIQPHFTGRPTRNFARASTKLNASQRIPTSLNVTKTLSFDPSNHREAQPHLREHGRRSQDSSGSQARSSGQLREDSNFSRLSAQSWMSIDSEETLTEREAKLLTSRTRGRSRTGSTASAGSAASGMPSQPIDHDPATLFGADEDGNALERMSNDDPYCLSVLECCAIIQIGADISKKLAFNRYEQRRVWMSSDYLRLCWTSKKAGVNEDHIKLSQVAKMKLADRNLGIDMLGGYSLCFVFPSFTSAGLWVRALACLVPLQAQIKVPLGVSIATEKEREEFSLAEDKFGERDIREYMTVNNYVTLCNPTCTPRNLGLKIAFSLSGECVYGFRYVPRQAIHHVLRTRKEIAVLKRLSHPNLVKYFEVLEDPNRGGMYVVFETLSRGCIADSSNLQRMQIYKEAHVRMVMLDIVDALLYLHSVRITHGDVRPENILMAPNGCAKLNPIGCIMHDFNHIENRTAHVRCRLGKASPAFLAPEQCWLSRAPKAGRTSTAMDVWGVGALMYTLLYGKTPFHGYSNHEIQENICWSTMRFPIDTPMSKEAKSLMFQILSNKDPRTRMTMSEVRDHPWFNAFSVTGSNSPRQSFSEFFDSTADGSPLMDISPEELNNSVQPAKVRVTARKKKVGRAATRRRA